VATVIRGGVIEEAGQRRLTAITHNHDFGIDTVLVPGRPVRIQARIGRHCGSIRGNEGTRRSSAEKMGTKRKGEGREGRGGEERRGGEAGQERRRGRETLKRSNTTALPFPGSRRPPRRDRSRGMTSFVSPIGSPGCLAFPSSSSLSTMISRFPLLPSDDEIFMVKKSMTGLNVSTSFLTLVLPAQGTQTLHPFLSTGDTPKRMSQACTRVTSSLWRPKTCAYFKKKS